MAVKATLLAVFSSAWLACGTGADGFLAQEAQGREGATQEAGVVTPEKTFPSVEPPDMKAEVGEVSAEVTETPRESQDLLDYLETLAVAEDAASVDTSETGDAQAAATANCDTRMLRKLQKKVGYHTWHECVDPNPEICHRIDSAIKAYLRKGGKGAATKSICRHQDDFRDAFEHNHEKCKELIRKADHEGLHLPGSMEDLKHMCR